METLEQFRMRTQGFSSNSFPEVELGYALMPHITMAYYKPGIYGHGQRIALRNVFKEISSRESRKKRNV